MLFKIRSTALPWLKISCEVHKQFLRPGKAKVVYGYVKLSSALVAKRQIEAKAFPNAQILQLGGCRLPVKPKASCWVLFCPQCRQAEQNWWSSYFNSAQ